MQLLTHIPYVVGRPCDTEPTESLPVLFMEIS